MHNNVRVFTASHVFVALCMLKVVSLAVADDGQPSAKASPLVQRNRVLLTLEGAELALNAAKQKAIEMKLPVNISVVDDGGHLLAFVRMNGARPASAPTSMTKATSAATKRGATGPLPLGGETDTHLSLAIENAAGASGGKFTTLKGGIPILIDGQVIGAVGVGGATGEEDAIIATAGVTKIVEAIQVQKVE